MADGDHPPTPEGQKPVDNASNGDSSTPSTDDKKVPLSELVKQRQAAAEAKKSAEDKDAKIKELEERLAKSEKPKGDETPPKAADETPPKPNAKPNEDDPGNKARDKQLDEVLRKDAIRDLRDEHEGMTFKQAEKIHELQTELPGLSFDEAYAIAASRNIDLFSEEASASAGFDRGTHGAGRPAPSGAPTPQGESDTPARLKFIKDHRKKNRKAADKVFNNLIGNIAAEQVGMQGHQRIKIPRS